MKRDSTRPRINYLNKSVFYRNTAAMNLSQFSKETRLSFTYDSKYIMIY